MNVGLKAPERNADESQVGGLQNHKHVGVDGMQVELDGGEAPPPH